MLIDREGRSIGTVSGGCLEADVVERAKMVLSDAEPFVISYDTTKQDNSVFGLGMGCRGVVRVLLEPAAGNESLAFVRGCLEQRQRGVVATLISKTNGIKLPIASRFYSRGDGTDQIGIQSHSGGSEKFLPDLLMIQPACSTSIAHDLKLMKLPMAIWSSFLRSSIRQPRS